MVSALRFGLLGHPVGHSVSPAIHQAAYEVFDLPHVYTLCDCPDASDVERQVQALRSGEWAGLNVTVPWKRVALKLADDVDDSARETGAANVLVRGDGGRIVAHNTDAPALARLLTENMSHDAGRNALVLGNGGAALAAVVAAKRAGVTRVFVSARRWVAGGSDWQARKDFERLGASPVAWGLDHLSEIAPSLSLVVQGTSAGMKGAGSGVELAGIVPWSLLSKQTFAYDVVYNPEQTPFLASASTHGLRHDGGLSMLVGQAAFAMQLWLGVEPPLELLMNRARSAIFGHEVTGA